MAGNPPREIQTLIDNHINGFNTPCSRGSVLLGVKCPDSEVRIIMRHARLRTSESKGH